MESHDLTRKTESDTGAVLFSCEERYENLLLTLLADWKSVVDNIDNDKFKEEKNILAYCMLVVYAYLCGRSANILQDGDVSLGAYVLSVFTNQHYILYGLLIYGLYWMVKDIRVANEIEKIRKKRNVPTLKK